ncbi:MAG: adenylate/guanylate cyclase domain-containing protein [Pseudomonadota bacterium]
MTGQSPLQPLPLSSLSAILEARAHIAPTVFDGPDFENWLVKNTLAVLKPVARVGVWVLLAAILAGDIQVIEMGLWEKDLQWRLMILWHAAMLSYFLCLVGVLRFGVGERAPRTVVVAAIVGAQGLFTWFGYISWALSGDLSLWAMCSMVVASVMFYPGRLRIYLYSASAAGLAVTMYMNGRRPEFFVNGDVINMVVVVVMASMIDRFMMAQNQDLFRRQRMEAYERARADDILYNTLPVSIADELKRNNIVKAEKYDRMPVLFADIVGFTSFSSKMPPDALVYVLNEIFSRFDALVDQYQAEKIKTIGDAYMVVGKGNSVAIADLSLEFMRAIDDYNRRNGVDFSLRIGIHIGPTVAGVIGLKRFLYDVWGDAVNTASRMESAGEPGRIHVSSAFHAELADSFLFETRDMIEVKGKGQMQTYFLLGRASKDAPPCN